MNLIFQTSYWLIPLCILVGIGYSWLLYTKKTSLSSQRNWTLAAGRAILVSLLCFLLLNPLLRSNTTRTLKPVLVLGIDNSASINEMGAEALVSLKSSLQNFVGDISSSNYEVEVRLLDGAEGGEDLEALDFNEKKTDLGGFFRAVNEEFSGQNLRKVVLLSDGIANSGLSPLVRQFPFAVDVIGVGDTTIKRDLAIKGLTANKLAYLGNTFPIQVDVSASLFNGESTTLRIKQNDEVLTQEIVAFNSDDDFKSIGFQLNTNAIGKQRYNIELLPISGEYSTRNNYRDLVIDVVDGKEKILLVALTAHPDVKALKSIIEKNPLFELDIKIVQTDNAPEIERSEFDILILHQLPDGKGQASTLTTRLLAKMKPTFFILGAQSDINRFNGMQQVLGVAVQNNKMDKVTGAFNTSFKRFILNESYNNTISRLPPLTAPFGEYRGFPGADVLLYQKVGTVMTERPLLAVNTNVNRKAAVLSAEGIWQWRMEDFFMNDSHEAVDDVILKTLQLISVKEDKEKLRVYATQAEIDIDESVVFQTEAYDDLFERIYDVSVNLNVQGAGSYNKSFDYDVNELNTSFEISGLDAGVYSYSAEGLVLGKIQRSSGQFVVKDKDLEFLNTTADFDFLRTLASKNGGNFYTATGINELANQLQNEDIPSRLINTEDLREIINLKWLLPLLLLLASLEWGFRKYFGTY